MGVLIPPSVLDELRASESPDEVRVWIANVPEWIDSLRQTTFHVSPKLLASILLKYRK